MPEIRVAESGVGDTTDAENSPARCQLVGEPQPALDLGPGGAAVRVGRARMRRHDVPQEHLLLEVELLERAMDDRRRRLRGADAGELALGRERDPRDPRPAVPRSLADEKDGRFRARLEIRPKPGTEQPCSRPFAVLVEGLADPRPGELLDERVVGYDAVSVRGARTTGLRGRLDAPPTRRT